MVVTVELAEPGMVWCKAVQTLLARLRVPGASEIRLEGMSGPGTRSAAERKHTLRRT